MISWITKKYPWLLFHLLFAWFRSAPEISCQQNFYDQHVSLRMLLKFHPIMQRNKQNYRETSESIEIWAVLADWLIEAQKKNLAEQSIRSHAGLCGASFICGNELLDSSFPPLYSVGCSGRKVAIKHDQLTHVEQAAEFLCCRVRTSETRKISAQ